LRVVRSYLATIHYVVYFIWNFAFTVKYSGCASPAARLDYLPLTSMNSASPYLPPELYHCVLEQIPYSDTQTLLATTRVFPLSLHEPLFVTVKLKHPTQAPQLYKRLRRQPVLVGQESSDDSDRTPCLVLPDAKNENPKLWVKEFSLHSWTVDADVVVNLVKLLKRLRRLELFVGTNFAPEHWRRCLKG